VLAAGDGELAFTVGEVYGVMAMNRTSWPRPTVAKTMLRMTRPARRLPYLLLDRVGADRYQVHADAFSM